MKRRGFSVLPKPLFCLVDIVSWGGYCSSSILSFVSSHLMIELGRNTKKLNCLIREYRLRYRQLTATGQIIAASSTTYYEQ